MREKIVIKKGKVIFKEGDAGDCMYDLLLGKVGVYTGFGTDNQKEMAILETGAFFGEMALVDKMPRSATVVALEDCEVEAITEESLNSYLKDRPANVYLLMQHTSSRLRELSADYVEACQAIAEYVDDVKTGKPRSPELIAKMKKIAQVSRK